MFTRFVNTILLVVMVVLFLTGVGMLYGTWLRWVFDLHRIAGFALVALLPWKGIVVVRSLKRRLTGEDPWPSILASVPMAPLLLLVAVLGLMWLWRIGPYLGPLGQTVIAWHWIVGLLMIPLFIIHVALRWPAPELGDFTARRQVLKLLGLGAAGVVGWLAGVALGRARATEARPRRAVTGSRGFGAFTGNDFPVTGEPHVDLTPETWRLRIEGAVAEPLVLTYDEILSMAAETTTATVDCTSGWYSVQEWSGVPLARLLASVGAAGAAGVRLVSATAYNHAYPMAEAKTILLATHVSGEVLTPRHGYPLRAVVPGRRGWFWVKWLDRIEVLDDPAQVVGGTLNSPRQVLRQF